MCFRAEGACEVRQFCPCSLHQIFLNPVKQRYPATSYSYDFGGGAGLGGYVVQVVPTVPTIFSSVTTSTFMAQRQTLFPLRLAPPHRLKIYRKDLILQQIQAGNHELAVVQGKAKFVSL